MKNEIYNALGVNGWELANELDHIGGNSQDIIDRVQGLYENGQMLDFFTGNQMSVQECSKECIASLRGELVRVWIGRMSRETASALMTAFAGMRFAKITLTEGVELFPGELSAKWNEAHKNEEPVFAVSEDEHP